MNCRNVYTALVSVMRGPLIAIVGDIDPTRTYDPPMNEPAKAKMAAEELGAQLANRGARLLVYGGPFLEAHVVRGFVAAGPKQDRSILMWYSSNQAPTPFLEEATHPKLFERRSERGGDWVTAFYRSIARADGLILIGGETATMNSGQVAIGSRIPILTLPEFGGSAAKVWDSLTPGEDLPVRDEVSLMAEPWTTPDSAPKCIEALFAQYRRKQLAAGTPRPAFAIIAGVLFLAALSIIPLVWGRNFFAVWMLFMATPLAGGAGSALRPMVDRLRGKPGPANTVLTTVVLGLIAGGMAGLLFVTAQLTGDPKLTTEDLNGYATRTIPYAVAIGLIAGLTSDVVFGKLLGLEVVRTTGITTD